MIYYFHEAKTLRPELRIKGYNNSFNLEVNVGMWFPNTKANVKRLLQLIKENDEDNRMDGVLATLTEDLRSSETFKARYKELKSSKMFCKMLNNNIEQVRLFAGLYC